MTLLSASDKNGLIHFLGFAICMAEVRQDNVE